MERLTMSKGVCQMASTEFCMSQEDCYSCLHGRKVFKCLAAYEDAMPLERAQELAQAEKDGRLVVLPCKVGDMVYQTNGLDIYESEVRKIVFDTDNIAFDESAIGKSIFLTREEADAALKKREAEGNEHEH